MSDSKDIYQVIELERNRWESGRSKPKPTLEQRDRAILNWSAMKWKDKLVEDVASTQDSSREKNSSQGR
jgi:hypothetical protein